MAGPDHEIFVVALVTEKLRQLTFKETIKIIFLKKKIQSTPLNKKPTRKTYKLQKREC